MHTKHQADKPIRKMCVSRRKPILLRWMVPGLIAGLVVVCWAGMAVGADKRQQAVSTVNNGMTNPTEGLVVERPILAKTTREDVFPTPSEHYQIFRLAPMADGNSTTTVRTPYTPLERPAQPLSTWAGDAQQFAQAQACNSCTQGLIISCPGAPGGYCKSDPPNPGVGDTYHPPCCISRRGCRTRSSVQCTKGP